jgi:superfamily II DNA or RNA helicase
MNTRRDAGFVTKVQLRGWQQEAFSLYQGTLGEGGRVSLWEATPGAGKTTAALQVVRHQLKTRLAQYALIVVPTSHLRIQWTRAAAELGVQLDGNFGSRRTALTSDFHGAIVTYQQIGNRAQVFRSLASKSVVVLDEVHHAGDGLSWGNALQSTLLEAKFILCLSGTAFRSDSNPIPFVRYDQDGISRPDYSYTYARAVEDKVCRPTAFFTYGGDVSWAEYDKVISASFSDPLDPATSARRLRAALEPEAGWINPLLKDAHDMLLRTRKEHPRAGGLVVCADQDHARQMARLVSTTCGEKPTVVLSDDKTASKKIKQYADSTSMWLVACNMVSEGVDIPRLRVGVYATTIRTKMYFRQFLGRIVRREQKVSGLQVAYLYLPADPTLRHFAEEIETETRHSLKRKESPFDDDRERRNSEDTEKATWTALQAINSGIDSVIVHGNQLTLFGGGGASEDVSEAIHREVEMRFDGNLTRTELKIQLASDIQRLVGKFHRKTGKSHSTIHTFLNRKQSVRSQTHCTEQQLRERLVLLEQMLD